MNLLPLLAFLAVTVSLGSSIPLSSKPAHDVHKPESVLKASEEAKEASVYGQSPDASEVGVPIDDIPVQTAIVKSLVGDEVKLDPVDFPGLLESKEESIVEQVKSSESSSDKVSIKLSSRFAAALGVTEGPAPVTVVTESSGMEGRSENDDQVIFPDDDIVQGHSGSLGNSVKSVPSSEAEDSPQPLHYSAEQVTTVASEVSSEMIGASASVPAEDSTASKYWKIGEKAQVRDAIVHDEVSTVIPSAAPSVASSTLSPIANTVAAAVTMATSSSLSPAKYGDSKATEVSELIADSVDQATKLLIDLEEQVKVYLNSETGEETGSTSVPLAYGAGSSGVGPVIKELSVDLPEPSETEAENINKQGATQIQSMIDEVNRVAQNVETVISELVSSRRYVTAAVFRSLLNYLRRVRISLERLQNRMQTIGVGTSQASNNVSAETAAVASSLGGGSTSGSSSSSSSGSTGSVSTITSGYLDAIRDRIYRITDEIRVLISRLRLTFSPSPSPSRH